MHDRCPILRALGLVGAVLLCGCGTPAAPLPQQERTSAGVAAAPPTSTTRPQSEALRFDFEGQTADNGVPAPWVATVSSGELNVKVEPNENERGKAIRLRSEQASFLLRNRQEFDPAEFRLLRWSWRATVLPTDGDVRKNALLIGENLNDQAVQVLVVFEGNKVLSFVWDSTAPIDTEVDEPSPLATVKTRVLDSGSEHLDTWRKHEVDLYDEYERRFGQPPRRALGVIVQSNANHTRSVGEGLIGPLEIGRYSHPGGSESSDAATVRRSPDDEAP